MGLMNMGNTCFFNRSFSRLYRHFKISVYISSLFSLEFYLTSILYSVVQILHLITPMRRIILYSSPSPSPSSAFSSPSSLISPLSVNSSLSPSPTSNSSSSLSLSLLQTLQKLFAFLSYLSFRSFSPPSPILRAMPPHFIPGRQQARFKMVVIYFL